MTMFWGSQVVGALAELKTQVEGLKTFFDEKFRAVEAAATLARDEATRRIDVNDGKILRLQEREVLWHTTANHDAFVKEMDQRFAATHAETKPNWHVVLIAIGLIAGGFGWYMKTELQPMQREMVQIEQTISDHIKQQNEWTQNWMQTHPSAKH